MAVQFCVVDGRASTRASWNKSGSVNGNVYVACDFHSLNAIESAVLNLAAGAARSISPSSSVPSSRNHNITLLEPWGA